MTPMTSATARVARQPDVRGWAERAGGRIGFEVFGRGDPPIVFVPPWQIVHGRVWKAQIPDFARRHRVVAWDARGNGRSDRPRDPAAHTTRARAACRPRLTPASDTIGDTLPRWSSEALVRSEDIWATPTAPTDRATAASTPSATRILVWTRRSANRRAAGDAGAAVMRGTSFVS